MKWFGIVLILAGLWNYGWVLFVFEHPVQMALSGIVGTFSILAGIFMIVAEKKENADE